MAANVYVDAFYRDHVSAESQQSFDRVIGSAKKLAATLGVAFGAYQIVTFLRTSSKAALESEQVYQALRFQVEALGKSYDAVEGSLRGYFDRLKVTTGFEDEQAAQAMIELVDNLGDYDLALKVVPMALDVARRKTLDLAMASKLVSAALMGEIELMNRQFITMRTAAAQLGEHATATQKAAFWIKYYEQNIKGAAEETNKGNVGAFRNLSIVFKDIYEDVGAVVNDVLAPYADKIAKARQDTDAFYNEIIKRHTILATLKAFDLWGILAGGLGKPQEAAIAAARQAVRSYTDEMIKAIIEIGPRVDEALGKTTGGAITEKDIAGLVSRMGLDKAKAKQAGKEAAESVQVFINEAMMPIKSFLSHPPLSRNWLFKAIMGPISIDRFERAIKDLFGKLPDLVNIRELLEPIKSDFDNFYEGLISKQKWAFDAIRGSVGALTSGIHAWLMSGLKDWKAFFDAILSYGTQMIAQLIAQFAVFSALKGIFSGFGVGKTFWDFFTAQGGYQGYVNRPTMFVAGERGTEYVSVTPQRKMAPSGGTTNFNFTIHALDSRSVEDWLLVRGGMKAIARCASRGLA